jgi:protein O-GlcNAc transferase
LSNLGVIHHIREELNQAEALYEKALALFEAIGAQPEIEQVRAWLMDLPKRHP